ncbi:hypothetical protein ADIWIN_2769 [Winogradskyella psychrotolerans RS-3]|uniref:Outer membrane protein beta-barrel domain-containing protein n=2 Tax=Winogradskyella TaxID=286104 RepID=S7WZT0_9FLAO|nr:hypothetical protein [Winogradskyella psychrotolerans]EPR72269.1 hypothetical protein ADIWIN_2769 [Winogradskyella psychrotolerans RS-3]
MKTRLFIIAFFLFNSILFAQSKFTLGFDLSEQFMQKDVGLNIEGLLGYNLNSDITLVLSASNATMENKDLDLKYKLDKYAFQVNYDFGKSESSKFESIFGFSYVNFDKKLNLEDDNGLGIDLGVQVLFGLKNKLHYGLRIVSTYSSISPGGVLNAGAIFKYNL